MRQISDFMLKRIAELRAKNYGFKTIKKLLGTSKNTVKTYCRDLANTGYAFNELAAMDEHELATLIDYASKQNHEAYQNLRQYFQDYAHELKRVGVTRYRLWQGYKAVYPDGYGYTSFCNFFKEWSKEKQVHGVFEYRMGDKLFVDFTGKRFPIVDPSTGELIEKEVFVAILGFSRLIYAEAVDSQKEGDFLQALENAIRFLNGVPQVIVPDNLPSGVKKSDRYEAEIQGNLARLASHYNITILPTRSYKPRDKAMVEQAVQPVYQEIFAPLRDENFFSLQQLNQAFRKYLDQLNRRNFQRCSYSRYDLFEEEKQHLNPLPQSRFEPKYFQKAKVYTNSHIWHSEDKHYYSVPYRYVGKKVYLAYTPRIVEVYYKNQRIAFHLRNKKPYSYTTEQTHLPERLQYTQNQDIKTLLKQGRQIGDACYELMLKILNACPHPEQGFNRLKGLLSLSRKYSNERFIKACQRALEFGHYSYKGVKNILENNLEDQCQQGIESLPAPDYHANVRGGNFYQ